MSNNALTVVELAERIDARLIGRGDAPIVSVSTLQQAGPNDITFLSDTKHISKLKASNAAAVIVPAEIKGLDKIQLAVENVDVALIAVLEALAPKLSPAAAGLHSTAVIGQNCRISATASIGPHVVIADGVAIGDGSILGAGCSIGENSRIGSKCRLDNNVVVYHNCTIGSNVVIQANSTIGSTGFGYVPVEGVPKLIPHNGTVKIEDFVEIGAGCCIDRAKFGSTIIGMGTKIDNLVHIAHNVVIGRCCIIAGQAGIAGSSELGNGVMLGGQVGISDHKKIGDFAKIGAQAGVIDDIEPGSEMLGTPAHNAREVIREWLLIRRLPQMFEQLKRLKARMRDLESAENNKK
ncbi:MAG: UDP-3-O-(3-hydroxymyristoyl)glucosamine N-acyltransferase [Planctomycetota bacterium]